MIELKIPSSVFSIGKNCISLCISLKHIEIENYAFKNFYVLKQIEIPSFMISIQSDMYDGSF